MILPFIRSSALSQLDFCEASAFMTYGLGIQSGTNRNAAKGSIVHKILEIVARNKLAKQNGEVGFSDPETGLEFTTKSFQIPHRAVFDHYRKEYDFLTNADANGAEGCQVWAERAMSFDGGEFNPDNLHIISPEMHFDFLYEEDWARIGDGYLRLKGTMDLVYQGDEPGSIAVLDWKCGKRIDWGTGIEKDYAKLCTDLQLEFYAMCIFRLYPELEDLILTIFYINHGGPFAIPFSRTDLPRIKRRIRSYYDRYLHMKRPRLNKSWRCSKFCHFGTHAHPDGQGETLCAFYENRVKEIGISAVIEQYGDTKAINQYQGGGKTL